MDGKGEVRGEQNVESRGIYGKCVVQCSSAVKISSYIKGEGGIKKGRSIWQKIQKK